MRALCRTAAHDPKPTFEVLQVGKAARLITMISFLVGRTWSRASQLMLQFYCHILPSILINLSSATGIGRTRRSERALQPAVDLGSNLNG
jgi:hypothetical protein